MSAARTLRTWVLAQLGQFLGLVGQFAGIGIALAVARRQFRWRAFAVAAAVLVLGTAALLWRLGHGGGAANALWAAGAAGALGAGALAGRLSRRLAFWELQLAVAVAAAVALVQLAYGWATLVHGAAADADPALQFGAPLSFGLRFVGPMWDRLLAMAAVGGFVLALIGSSGAALVWGDGGAADLHFGLAWRLARRYLSRPPRGPVGGGRVSVTAAVAVAGIALGVAALVTVTAVMSGYQQDIQGKILSANAHLVVQKYGIDFAEYGRVGATAAAVPGVAAASPFIFNEAMLASAQRGTGVLVKGIDPERAAAVTGIATNLCAVPPGAGACQPFAAPAAALQAALAPEDGVPSVLLGATLFARLGLPLGARLALTTPVGVAGARGNAPKRLEFRVGGVFRSGMHEFDARLVYLDLAAAQRLLGMGDTVTGVEFRLDDPDDVDAVGRDVLTALGRYPYRTLSWRELNAGIFTALQLQKVVMFVVLTFIVVVASFNIASTLFMAVVEKAREIAVLKSMGAGDAEVMKIFVLQGWLTGGVGTALGVLLGLAAATLLGQLHLGIAADVYMVDSLAVRLRPLEVGLTAVAALGIAHLATLYPALRAARQRPVDAMRQA